MKPGSARRQSSRGAGRHAAAALRRPRTNGRNRPIFSAPSALSVASAPASSCPTATPRPCNGISTKISSQVTLGAHAVLILDQAGWHTTGKLTVPPNITLLPLPPRSPELNPVENIWQFMRDNWLSNRIFDSYEQIVELCCEAWNKLIDQPWKIMSIGRRQWANGF